MVVEDEPQVRALTCRILRSGGFRVVEADTPQRALELSVLETPRLLLTDVVMPEMSGDVLAERLRAAHPELRVVFMTGYSGAADLDRFGDEATVVLKPFAADDLLAALSAQLGA